MCKRFTADRRVISTTRAIAVGWLLSSTLLMAGVPDEAVVFSDDFSDVGADGIPKGWSFWIPNAKMELTLTPNVESIQDRKACRVAGNGNQHAKGSLRHAITGLRVGESYKFEVAFATQGIDNVHDRVKMVVRSTERSYQNLIPRSTVDGIVRANVVMPISKKMGGDLTLELFAGWIPDGTVDWLDVKVTHLPDFQPETNPVKVAVIDSMPPKGSELLEGADFYVREIARAANELHPDVIALGENFHAKNIKGSPAISMDSEYMRRLKQAAQKHRVNLIGSVKEDDNGVHFNTAVLIDRQGELLGKYRKSHLTTGEALFTELSRGDDLTVFDTDFGRVGILVCWDYHFPEAVRTLVLKGAEIIFVPLAGDGRHFEENVSMGIAYSGKAIAIDNRIPIVFSVTNSGGKCASMVINQQAEIVAQSSADDHIIGGTVDTKQPVYHWSGTDFRSVYRVDRRPELYKPLVDRSLNAVLMIP